MKEPSELEALRGLCFFRAVPEPGGTNGDLVSSLQSFETCLFLIAYGRRPHALTTCASAIESAARSAGLIDGRKEGLQAALQKLAKASPSMATTSDSQVELFRAARNRITHHGFSPRDDSESVVLLITAGFPILSACYRDLHGFELFDSLRVELRELLETANEIVALVGSNSGKDLSYALNPLAHQIRWSLQQGSAPSWESEALIRSEEVGIKYEHVAKVIAELKRAFDDSCWEVSCPICFEPAICELAPLSFDGPEVGTGGLVCPNCDFVIRQSHDHLSQILVGKQLQPIRERILTEYGFKP